MLWHPKTFQNIAIYSVFCTLVRFSIAGSLRKWPKIPFQYPLKLRHPKIVEKSRKHHLILVSVRNRFCPPPSWYSDCYINKCDWAFSVAVCTPISTPSPPKRCGRICWEFGLQLEDVEATQSSHDTWGRDRFHHTLEKLQPRTWKGPVKRTQESLNSNFCLLYT